MLMLIFYNIFVLFANLSFLSLDFFGKSGYIHNLNNKYYSLRSKRKSNIKIQGFLTQDKIYKCIWIYNF